MMQQNPDFLENKPFTSVFFLLIALLALFKKTCEAQASTQYLYK